MMTSITAWLTAVISLAALRRLLVGVMVEEHLQEPSSWKEGYTVCVERPDC